MSQQVENLLHLAHEAGLSEEFMWYLIDYQGIANLIDLREITPHDMVDMKEEYLRVWKKLKTNPTFGFLRLQGN